MVFFGVGGVGSASCGGNSDRIFRVSREGGFREVNIIRIIGRGRRRMGRVFGASSWEAVLVVVWELVKSGRGWGSVVEVVGWSAVAAQEVRLL